MSIFNLKNQEYLTAHTSLSLTEYNFKGSIFDGLMWYLYFNFTSGFEWCKFKKIFVSGLPAPSAVILFCFDKGRGFPFLQMALTSR